MSASLRAVAADDQPVTPVERARFHEAEADRHADQEDHHRWEAARAYLDAADSGMTVREIAEALDKGKSHVGYVLQVARVHLGGQPDERPRWNVAYQTAKGGAPKGPVPGPETVPDGPDDGPEGEGPDDAPEPPRTPLEVLADRSESVQRSVRFLRDHAIQHGLGASAVPMLKSLANDVKDAIRSINADA